MYRHNRVVVEAPCKVNLSLDIVGETGDGYHLLETVMQSIDLCDVLVIGKRRDGELCVTCSDQQVPVDNKNIAYKAAVRFFAAAGIAPKGLSIHIDKAVPIEAGLAGGSADAAAVLRGLDLLFETGLAPELLSEIGLSVGADVPFCLSGGCAFARGKGEALSALRPLPDCLIVVAKPPVGVSTHHAFSLYDSNPGRVKRPRTREMLDCIEAGDLEGIGRNMLNVFDGLVGTDETETIRGVMLSAGALGAVLSGSGSAVVGLFKPDEEEKAKQCLLKLLGHTRESWITRPVRYGARVIYVG